MDQFVTIRTFTYAMDLAVIRGKLESEGIECFAQDEMMAQTNPLYSNAIGGIKLQVRRSDAERATEVLKEGGYLSGTDQPTPLFRMVDTATKDIPLLKTLAPEFRLMLIVGLLAVAILLLLLVVNGAA